MHMTSSIYFSISLILDLTLAIFPREDVQAFKGGRLWSPGEVGYIAVVRIVGVGMFVVSDLCQGLFPASSFVLDGLTGDRNWQGKG